MKEMEKMFNLQPELNVDIFSRLPVRTVISCKCVCKKWFEMISSHEFAKLHFSRSSPGLIVTGGIENPHMVFEFEDEVGFEQHELHYKLVMEFDPDIFRSSSNPDISSFNPFRSSSNPDIFSSSSKSFAFRGCSSNGWLCLYNRSRTGSNTFYICNPITREYVALPQLHQKFKHLVVHGAGTSMLSGEFKVVCIHYTPMFNGDNGSIVYPECRVYTLGTDSWRSIELNEMYAYYYSEGVFLNGNLHWRVHDGKSMNKISSFDLEAEIFKPLHVPLKLRDGCISLSVLDDCLCLCVTPLSETLVHEEVDVWMMKEYGVQESWTKIVVTVYKNGVFWGYTGVFSALKVFKDGDVSMYKPGRCVFCPCKKIEANRLIHRREKNNFGDFWAVLHTPSFVSLRSLGLENVTSF